MTKLCFIDFPWPLLSSSLRWANLPHLCVLQIVIIHFLFGSYLLSCLSLPPPAPNTHALDYKHHKGIVIYSDSQAKNNSKESFLIHIFSSLPKVKDDSSTFAPGNWKSGDTWTELQKSKRESGWCERKSVVKAAVGNAVQSSELEVCQRTPWPTLKREAEQEGIRENAEKEWQMLEKNQGVKKGWI